MFATRVPFAAVGGALFSVAIFLGLAQLTAVPFDIPPSAEAIKIEFTRQRFDTPTEARRPPKVVQPPPTIIIEPRGPTEVTTTLDSVRPVPTQLTRPPRTALPVGADRDVTPLVRINPDYPHGAATRGIEGWAKVRFTVTATGATSDAVIVASEPGDTFDAAALEALARWRYNPRVENGVAVERVGLETMFRFELEN